METLLQKIPGVVVYLDDTLITGRTTQEHLQNLENVLRKLQEAVLWLNRKKCKFLIEKVVYLGQVIDADGLHPDKERFRAITDSRNLKNVSELKSFLCLLFYYGKFLCNLSTVLAPLHDLLKKGAK